MGMKKAQTRFEFWDGMVMAACQGGNQETMPEAVAEQAVVIADYALKARDERAAFLLQRKPGEIEEKAAAAKAAESEESEEEEE